MSVIYKYPVELKREVQKIIMPSSSIVLSAIEQNGMVVLYALVPNPHANPIWNDEKRILVLGTGWEIDGEIEFGIELENMRFIDTVKTGAFVWHVFEVVDRSDNREHNEPRDD